MNKKNNKTSHSISNEQALINQLQTEVNDLTEALKRSHADFINHRRRVEEDKLRSIRFGRESAIMALLPVIDNIERAFMHTPKELTKNEWAIGVKQVTRQLEDALKGIGVEKFESVGQVFNPEFHEAVIMDDGKGKKEVVVEEIQPGYSMDGEVIRHAMVKVGRK
jgi:molecular chaperone GrpE